VLSRDNDLLAEGDRNKWYAVQPYLIGIFTSPGIPFLWQGQELGENYVVPDQGWGRVMLFRPVRWDYFYDPVGKALVGLVRKLVKLRRELPQLRQGDHYFYNHHDRYQSRNVLVFSRRLGNNFTLVALNFGPQDQAGIIVKSFMGWMAQISIFKTSRLGWINGSLYPRTMSVCGRTWRFRFKGFPEPLQTTARIAKGVRIDA
jgi:1,4-alpha-glucan branching enzyme